MKKTVFVSRHKATVEWAKYHTLDVDLWLEHLDDTTHLNEGDHVIGTLPINMVSKLNAKGVKYSHFGLTVPHDLRGKELTMSELLVCNPTLQAYTVVPIG